MTFRQLIDAADRALIPKRALPLVSGRCFIMPASLLVALATMGCAKRPPAPGPDLEAFASQYQFMVQKGKEAFDRIEQARRSPGVHRGSAAEAARDLEVDQMLYRTYYFYAVRGKLTMEATRGFAERYHWGRPVLFSLGNGTGTLPELLDGPAP